MITVFTPTYNRAYILPQLYQSLCSQTCKDFEWLIVNDGSTDNTSELILDWQKKGSIRINIINKENAGKSSAINIGVQNAIGSLFFIVDSDDFLTPDAIEKIIEAENKRMNSELEKKIAGYCYKRCNYRTGLLITSYSKMLPSMATSLELAFKYKVTGDKAEVFFTEILKKFPFPKLQNNKFVPEALVWYRIAAAGYKLIIKDDTIYQCDYIEDGYSKNFKNNLKKNNKGFALFYKECLSYNEIPILIKIKYIIRLIQCKYYEKIYDSRKK